MGKPQGVKKSREDILREKRERERERRRQIREDPIKKREQKEKERQKYLKQLQNKVKKSVKDMTPREHRQIRKNWKENSKNYRLKKKQKEMEISLLESNTPPASSDEENQPENVNVSFQRQIGRKIANRNKIKRYRENKAAERKMQDLKRKVQLYKKRYYRLLGKTKQKSHGTSNPDLTPLTKVTMLLDTSQIEPSKVEKIKKSLIFGEVVQHQLVNTYQELKSDQKKQVFKKMLDGKIIKKYKMRTKLSTVLKFRKSSNFKNKDITNFERKRGKHIQRTEIIKKIIKDFLELEDNSRVCPGKKEFVKKNKVTEQKRFLSNTLKNLYLKFLHAFPNYNISYKFFCLARPFYIKPMRVSDRETCKCIIHANMELIVQSLYASNVVFGKTPNDIIKDICCSTYAVDCLLRKCNNCKNAKPHFKEYNKGDLLQYFQWIYLKQNYLDKKTQTVKQTRKVAKQPKEVKTAELVTILMKKLPIFLSHEGRVVHQHHSISELKKVLKAKEIIIHCDFSENYSLKYAEEIQSFHFGGARQQITLHTVVVYSKDRSDDTVTKSYCTLSESLQHGPAAIWAHLQPILKEYTGNGVDIIHFLSDSPATQYRNKHMFSFITNHFMEQFPEVKSVSWNYHEAGHGKGAPDGIGGVCKRTADRVVAQGKDISSFESLVNVLTECCPGICFHVIKSQDIDTFASIISKQTLLAFKGTLKVHQIIPVNKKLWLRSLSCFTCTDFCNHFDLGSLSYEDVSLEVSSSSESHEESEDDKPLSTLFKNNYKLKFSDVYSDDEVPTCSYSTSRAKTGKYVLVCLKSVNKKLSVDYKYVAVCQSDFQEDDEIKVAFLKLVDHVNGDLFKSGEENDVSYVKEEQILEVLPEPELLIKGHRIYYKFQRTINVFETA